jgi:hypothetical protein
MMSLNTSKLAFRKMMTLSSFVVTLDLFNENESVTCLWSLIPSILSLPTDYKLWVFQSIEGTLKSPHFIKILVGCLDFMLFI